MDSPLPGAFTVPASPSSPIVVIGDVHGHVRALDAMLEKVDAEVPDARLVFVGDIGHKGPDSAGAYRTVLELVASGRATMVASNHGRADADKLGRMLDRGMNVVDAAVALYEETAAAPNYAVVRHVAALAGDLAGRRDGDELASRIVASQRRAPAQLELDRGRLLVVHGGITPEVLRQRSRKATQVCLYGTPTGRDPETGLPVGRDSWVDGWCAAARDGGLPFVVYGHITYPTPRVTDATCGIDTGCGSPSPDAALTAAVWTGSPATIDFLRVPAPTSTPN